MKLAFSLILVLVASLVYAVEIEQYLMSNESNASIAKEFFTLNKTAYYLVNISGEPTFLVKGDELVVDRNIIHTVLKSYYISKYSVNSSELSLLRSYLLAYNASRNDGGKFKGQEEQACRKALFLDKYPCIDDKTCNKTALILCAYQNNAGAGCNDFRPFVPMIKDFAFSSDLTEAIMADMFDKIENINVDNAVDYISQMKKNFPLLAEYKKKIESSLFRTPLPGEKCANCSGICPELDFNDSALENAQKLVDFLAVKTKPLKNYLEIADLIYNNTQIRIKQHADANMRLYYLTLYNPIYLKATAVKASALKALAHVSNDSVKAKIDQIISIEKEINASLDAANFSNLNATLAEYSQLVDLLNKSIEPLIAMYNNISESYRLSTVYLFIAEGESLSHEDQAKLDMLKQKKIELDQEFKNGLTMTQYNDIKARYDALIAEEKALISKQGAEEQTLYIFAGMSNKFVDAVDSLLAEVRPLTYAEKLEYSNYLPAAISIGIFVSFSSLVIFLFFLYYALSHKPIKKIWFVILAMFLVFVIALISLGVFFSLSHSLNSLKYTDFMNMLKDFKSAVIAIQKNGADPDTLAAMRSCAYSISTLLADNHIHNTIYELSGNSCTINGTSVQNCLDNNSNPVIMMNASTLQSSSYSGLLLKQATFAGDKVYYSVCPFAELLKIS